MTYRQLRSSSLQRFFYIAAAGFIATLPCCFSVVMAAPQGGTIAGTTDKSFPVDGNAIGEAAFGSIQAVLVDATSSMAAPTKTRVELGSYTVLEEKYIRRVFGGKVTTLVNRSSSNSVFTAIGQLGDNYLVLDSSTKRCVRTFSKAPPHTAGVFYGRCADASTTNNAQGLDVDPNLKTVYIAQTFEEQVVSTMDGKSSRVVCRRTGWQPLRIFVANASFGIAVDAKFDIYTVDLKTDQGSTVPQQVTNVPVKMSNSKPLTPIAALDRTKQIFYYLANPESETANTSSIIKWDLKSNTFSNMYTFRTVESRDGSDPTFSSITSMAVTPDSNIIIGQEGKLRYLLVRGFTNTPTMTLIPTEAPPSPPPSTPPPPPTPPPRTRTKTIRAFANITASFLISGFPFHNETEMEKIKQLMMEDAVEAMDGLTPISDMYIETINGERYFTAVFTGVYLDKQEEAQRRLDNCQWRRLRKDFMENGRGAICVYQDGESECDEHYSTRCDSLGCHLAVALTIALCFLIILLVIIFLALTVGGRAFLKSALLLYPVSP